MSGDQNKEKEEESLGKSITRERPGKIFLRLAAWKAVKMCVSSELMFASKNVLRSSYSPPACHATETETGILDTTDSRIGHLSKKAEPWWELAILEGNINY